MKIYLLLYSKALVWIIKFAFKVEKKTTFSTRPLPHEFFEIVKDIVVNWWYIIQSKVWEMYVFCSLKFDLELYVWEIESFLQTLWPLVFSVFYSQKNYSRESRYYNSNKEFYWYLPFIRFRWKTFQHQSSVVSNFSFN